LNCCITAWDAKKEANRLQAKANKQQLRDEANTTARLAEQQLLAEKAKAEKKQPKLRDFDDSYAPPSSHTLRASNYALAKTRNREPAELYHWTGEAMEKATLSNPTLSSFNTFTLANRDDSNLTILPTLSQQNSKHVVPSNKLTWEQFTEATPGYLKDIKAANWPDKHVTALASFFHAIQQHPSRLQPDGKEVLVQFAAEQRNMQKKSKYTVLPLAISLSGEGILKANTHHRNTAWYISFDGRWHLSTG
ncbi:hypothetical protein V5O48_018603, partial [Marasmius crinis-equi]